MLLRDAEASNGRASGGDVGIEVFMLKRTMNAAFVGGFYVFPGGVVDAEDGGTDIETLCDGLTDANASAQLGLESGGLAFWVAAVRECFEEAGVLLAEGVDFADPSTADRFSGYQHAIHDRTATMVDICRSEGLTLNVSQVEYVAHWITPHAEPRRFDTRFFVTRMPDGQTPLHDDNETIDSEWMRPADALRRQASGELQMLPPTMACLGFLEPHTTVGEAMAAATSVNGPPAMLPVALVNDGKFVGLLLPGDDGYDTALAGVLATTATGLTRP